MTAPGGIQTSEAQSSDHISEMLQHEQHEQLHVMSNSPIKEKDADAEEGSSQKEKV